MKARELMIADIVRYKGNAYKVCGILGYADVTQLHPLRKRDAEGKYLLPINTHDDIEPNLLTEEILKANGWYNVGSYKCVYKKDGVPFCVAISDAYPHEKILLSARIDISIIAMLYVHELQHALRLCGLNDLADNLKVI